MTRYKFSGGSKNSNKFSKKMATAITRLEGMYLMAAKRGNKNLVAVPDAVAEALKEKASTNNKHISHC